MSQLPKLDKSRKPRRTRHQRKCSICHHPDRKAIEEEFIRWRSPYNIALNYNLPDRSALYRHARATGLFAHRKRNLRFVLENLLERADSVRVTASSIVRAVRAYTRINDAGEWVEPPTRIIVISGSAPADASLVYTERGERAPSLAEGSKAAGPALPACPDRSRREPGQQKLIEGRRLKTRSILIATETHIDHDPTH